MEKQQVLLRMLLDEFCNELGFDKVYGRFYELGPEDRFTGEIVDSHLIIPSVF